MSSFIWTKQSYKLHPVHSLQFMHHRSSRSCLRKYLMQVSLPTPLHLLLHMGLQLHIQFQRAQLHLFLLWTQFKILPTFQAKLFLDGCTVNRPKYVQIIYLMMGVFGSISKQISSAIIVLYIINEAELTNMRIDYMPIVDKRNYSSQMERSHFACLAAGAALASAYFMFRNRHHESKNKEVKTEDYSGEDYAILKNQQLARVIKYFGEQKFEKMENSYVLVFGVGGVGSHVVNMLARSGVKKIRIVDFDRVSLSSLNRHSCALRQDVGTPKVECLKKYINQILPHVQIETVQAYVTVQNAAELLVQGASYVVDCIDNIDAKVQVVRLCKQRNIKLICSGGAGMKSDPTRLQIRDISDCKYDSLIMRLKRELGKKGIKSGVKVAYSYQQAEKELLPLNEEQEKEPQSFKVFDNYRIRIIPVLGTMPAIMGMAIASYVLCDLAGELYQPFETDYVKSTTVNKIYNELLNDEKRRGLTIKDMQVDMQQVSILAKQVFRWKSVISNKKQANPRLVRWDTNKPATIDNLALIGRQQYDKHWKFNSLSEAGYSEQVHQRFAEKSKYASDLYNRGYMMFI